jgi:hypothetical protein
MSARCGPQRVNGALIDHRGLASVKHHNGYGMLAYQVTEVIAGHGRRVTVFIFQHEFPVGPDGTPLSSTPTGAPSR